MCEVFSSFEEKIRRKSMTDIAAWYKNVNLRNKQELNRLSHC